VLGDVTQDNKANVNDINAIGKYIANRNKPGTGTGQTGVQKTAAEGGATIVLGDVTTDSKANVNDINAIGKYIANRNKPGTGTGQTGVQVEVLAEASAE
jgi:sigma54-dependent transcription regulator